MRVIIFNVDHQHVLVRMFPMRILLLLGPHTIQWYWTEYFKVNDVLNVNFAHLFKENTFVNKICSF